MADHPVSPLAPAAYPTLPAIDGITLATAKAGIRYKNRVDVLLVACATGTTVAGVFTRSLTASAPVLHCRKNIKKGTARALVVNSGNANAFTGVSGKESTARVAKATASTLSCKAQDIFIASTGVIGEKLAETKITDRMPALTARLEPNHWTQAAHAIMTTDTYPKMATRSVMFGGKKITINGIAKGSGMIAPDMATMLAFVFTDAAIPSSLLQQLLATATDSTFNAIGVDGDTSTSDTLLLFATGKAGNTQPKKRTDKMLVPFTKALHAILHDLALQIVKDGEGAEKLVTITVTGAANPKAARTIAMSIANSPLVKTALAASDANWGRIVMAVGKAGEKANRDKLRIKIGGVIVAKKGEAAPDYRETQIASHMKGRTITIEVDVGIGTGEATVWTCDLTHRYIDINGSYRT